VDRSGSGLYSLTDFGSDNTELIDKMSFKEIGCEGGKWMELLYNCNSSQILNKKCTQNFDQEK
jgi:hypothetical protein